jgi:hypothetical protein
VPAVAVAAVGLEKRVAQLESGMDESRQQLSVLLSQQDELKGLLSRLLEGLEAAGLSTPLEASNSIKTLNQTVRPAALTQLSHCLHGTGAKAQFRQHLLLNGGVYWLLLVLLAFRLRDCLLRLPGCVVITRCRVMQLLLVGCRSRSTS